MNSDAFRFYPIGRNALDEKTRIKILVGMAAVVVAAIVIAVLNAYSRGLL